MSFKADISLILKR